MLVLTDQVHFFRHAVRAAQAQARAVVADTGQAIVATVQAIARLRIDQAGAVAKAQVRLRIDHQARAQAEQRTGVIARLFTGVRQRQIHVQIRGHRISRAHGQGVA